MRKFCRLILTIVCLLGLVSNNLLPIIQVWASPSPADVLPTVNRQQLTPEPFLYPPYEGTVQLNCVFDHQLPLYNDEGTANRGTVVHRDGGVWTDGCESSTIGTPRCYSGHAGIDYAGSVGDNILAAADGEIVAMSRVDPGSGNGIYVKLDHANDYATFYLHLNDIEAGLNIADTVEQGDILGTCGSTGASTGPHLHFQLNDPNGNPVDPYGWVGPEGSDPWQLRTNATSYNFWAVAPAITNPGYLRSTDGLGAESGGIGVVVVDNRDAGFSKGTCWQEATDAGYPLQDGVGDTMFYRKGDETCDAPTWFLSEDGLTVGDYETYVFVPNQHGTTLTATYKIHHKNSDTLVSISQNKYSNVWAPLGTFEFDRDGTEFIQLIGNDDADPDIEVAADAVMFAPLEGAFPPQGIVDNRDPNPQFLSGDCWVIANDVGYLGRTHYTTATITPSTCSARWSLPSDIGPGVYEVLAFVPRAHATTQAAVYTVHHQNPDGQAATATAVVAQAAYSDMWASLGTYHFAQVEGESIQLEQETQDAAAGLHIAADAIRFVLSEDPDFDRDGISNYIECPEGPPFDGSVHCRDTDGDGVPDIRDTDSDQDTILDAYEAVCTPDNDFDDDQFPCNSDAYAPETAITDDVPDYRDLDSDGDGVFDLVEAGDQDPATPPVFGVLVGSGIPAFRHPNDLHRPYDISVMPMIEACDPADPLSFQGGMACGLEMIRDTLATAGITVTLEDPPVPAMLFATTPYPRPAGGAQTVLTTTTAPVTTPLAASFTTSHTVVSGDLQAAWTTDAWVAAQFATLTAPYAQLYDEHDTLLAAGPVQAAPAEGDAALALALGGDLTCTVDGRGALSFYAPATTGLGVGGTWETYTASVAAPGVFGVGLQGASVTVNGQAFTGPLTLVVSDTLTLHGAGYTVAPNFAAQVALTAQDAFVHLAAADAYDGYSGSLSISEHSAALDSVTLSGTYARRLAVAAVPAQSQVTPFETATFQATLSAVQGAVPDALPVTVTVVPPDGWTAALDASGQVAITPARTAAPGDYPVRLVAQAGDDVTLLAGAVHTVTLQHYNGMQWTVAPDPLTTVPWGPALALPPSGGAGGGTNTGQAQIPGAAYLATLTNTSIVAHTFRVEVTPEGFPTAWIALGGAGRSTTTTLTLAAGSVGRLGVYIAPVGLTSLPPAGTQYPFAVRAVAADAPALDQSAPAVFTMPAVPFNYLTAAPETLLATASVPATFDVTLTNVGNVNGTFTVQAVAPDGWVAGAPYSVSLAVGARDTRPYTFIAAGVRPGDTGIIRVQSPAPGSPYVQADTVNVRIVGPCTFEAAQATQSAAALDDTALTVALDDLTTQLGRWEQDSANAGLRARVQAAVALLQAQVARYPQLDAAAFAPLTATAVITDFCAPLAGLDANLGRLATWRVSARFIPGYDAALLDTPITYTLRLQNHGTLTTTYRVNLQLNHLASQQIHNQQILHPGTTWLAVIAPGQIVTQPVVLLPASLGAWQLAAQVEAVGDAFIQATATAGLNVVDAFVKVLAVNANPAFVETGVSSTALAVYIANIANVPRAVTAQVAILAPDATPVWTDSVALALQVGAPRIYALGTVTTSGWAAGVYTITVDLQDTRGVTIPDGAGYGFLAVGQALEATHGVTPSLVAPGTVTVTTVITTESTHTEEPDDTGWLLYTPMPARANAPDGPSRGGRPPGLASLELQEPLTTTLGITRYEEGDPLFVYTGTWAIRSMAYASAGQARRSNVAGNAASLTFDGTWVSVGLGTGADAGYVEVFIDGVSQGILDTYRNGNSVTTYVYDSLSPATHTISLTVLGARNDWASNSFVYVDHIDVWDGTALPEGFFEQDDARVYLSTNWSTASIAAASGGTYIRGGSNAWFPFIGETVTFQALAYSGGGKASVLVDGQFLGYIDLYSAAAVTRTFSYGPFASGPHVLQVQAYRGTATVDGFRVPAEPPPTPVPPPTGIVRYEEDNLALRYNSVPFTQTAGTWGMVAASRLSDGYAARSNTVSDTVSLTFDGSWVSVGLGAGSDCGYAAVFINGALAEVVDTYRNVDSVMTRVYDGLPSGVNTISIVVRGERNAYASNSRVYVDYIEVWDGTALPDGFFEQDDARVRLSANWTTVNSTAASGETYIRGGSNAWFPFTGETVTFQALAYSSGGKAGVLVDGQFQGYVDLYSASPVTRTFSYGSFTPGPHVLQVQAHRGNATVDGFRVPAAPPPTPVPPPTGIVRYEEDNLALRYNSVPFTQTAGTWGMVAASRLSDGYAARSNTVSDTVSLTFDGSWVSVGLGAGSDCGYAAVFINGALAEVVDTYRNVDSVMTRVYDGLPSGVNTISIVVRGERNAYASNSRVYVDYIEVWDGTALPDGFFEQDDARVRLSANWTTVNSTAASGETYIRGGSNAWFPFTGETVTFQALAYSSGGKAGVLVDGQFQGYVDLYSAVAVTRTFSYGPFTSGPHVLQVQAHRGNTTVDGFRVPAEPPPAPVPPPSGIVRYEEDDPALRYNGLPFTQTAITWSMRSVGHLSRGYAARSNTVSDTVSLTFDGTWASVGFGTGADCGHVEVFINGVSQGILDTYRNGNSVAMRVYDNLPPGVNTISIVVLGRKSDYSSNTYVYVDYIDVWDGEAIPDGFFEQDDARVRLSANWTTVNSTAASGGTYIRGGSNAWFPFTGETATFQALAYSSGGKAGVLVDGQFQGYVDLYSASLVTRTFSYGSFTPGPHVLQVQAHRGNATVDGFRTPAMGVSTPPTPIIRRVEEDDPNLRYNGHPFGKFPSGWEERTRDLVSDGYVYSSRTPGDVVILTLDSSWLVVGFHTRADSGMAQIRIGDVVSETVDLYAPAAGLLERFYTVPTGVHTITITVLTQRNPASSDGWVEFDYIDFWTGQESADTFYEAEWDVNVRTSHRWTEVANDLASGNAFLENGDNLWFGFTADSVSFHTFAAPDSPAVEVFIDGVSQGVVDPYFPALVPRVVNYTHLGPGPHILRIENLQNGRVDGFHTPVIPMPQEEVLLHLCVALDGSGSISAGEFDLMRRGLAATVRDRTTVPQNGALELSVVQFSSNAYVEILPTIIRDSATAEQVAHQIEMFTQKGGGTNMAAGIDLCAGLIVHSPQFSGASKRIINIVGDGEPTYPGPDPHQAAVDARIAAVAGGIDEVNFEAIGVSANTIAFLRDELVYPQPGYLAPPFIPEHGGFVIPVNNFADFEAAMRQKLQFVLETDVYHVDVEHSAPITDVIVLIDTIAPPSTHISTTGGQVQIAWQHVLTPNHRVETAMFQSRLPAMQPGEIRRVADGTLVRYTGTSGSGEISLPPLYVSAAHLLALMPFSRTTVAGNGAPYSVTLANPTTASATYTLTVSGLPADWVALPPTVTVAGAAAVTVPLHLTPPPDAEITAYTFAVNAATPTGGWDQAPGVLEVAEGFILALTPAQLTADYGATVTYTLTLSNAEPILREYTLQATGLASSSVQLPAMMSVPPGATRSVTVSVMAREPLGIHLLTVQASYTHAGTAVSAQASAGLAVQGEPGLTLALSPVQGVGGPDSPATYTVWVTNTGTFSDTYALNVSVPDGWAVQLWAHGAPAAQISLTPYVFNSAALQLLVTPPPGTPSGDYPLTVYAVATRAPALTAEVSGVATVAATGITVAISPPERVADPREPLTWNITLTNTSSVADTFTLTAGGVVVGGNAAWSINPVSLAPGASATVQLTSAPLDFVTPQSYPLSVVACAQSTPQVCNATTATVSFTEFAGVDVHLWPAAQTVSATLPAQYLMVVTNTGNIGTHYTLAATSIPPLDVLALDLADLYIPPHMTAQVLLTARTAQPGTYTLAVQADQGTFAATATAQLTVTTAIFNHPPVAVNDTFTTPMNVAITTPVLANDYDPDGDALTLDTVGPAGHGWVYRNPQDQLTYTPDTGFVGTDSFTYTLRDVHGSLAGATVTIQVTPVYDTPLVSLGPDRSVAEGSLITFTAAITDPDTPTGHTLHWDFGDGGTAGGTLTPTHVYADDGIYPVTLTVTDTTGLSGAGHLTVTVANVAPTLTAGPDRTVAVSETLAFNGVFTDPGVLDIHTIAWDFGDGITATGTLTPAHVYTAPGIYTATLVVADDDGGTGSDTLVITVTEQITPVYDTPLVSLGPDRNVAEGSPITLTVVITDPDTPTGHTLHWDFGDGGTADGTLTPTHVYADEGVYPVTLTVTDTTGLSGAGHLTVTVVNVAPTLTAGADRTAIVSETLTFSGVFTDPGVLDTHTIAWHFGDGITATGALTPTHAYTQPGVYTVTLTVVDNAGGVGSDTLVVTINASGPGAISGVIWNDLDGNGVQNGAETGLTGVYVMLFADDGDGVFEPEASDPGVTYTVTPDGGSYAFSDLAPGAYWVDVYEESAPAGYVRTTPAEDPLLVTLAAGEARTVDFGYRALSGSTCVTILRPGSAHEQVWDAYIWAASPAANSGNSTLLYSGLVGSGEKQSLLRFDLSALPENAVVDSAVLAVYFTTSKVQIVRMHQATATWQETAVTWNTFGGSYLDATEGYLVSLGTGFHAVDLTRLVRQWANGSAANYGVLLEQNSTAYDSYKSSEYSTASYRPQLQVCYHAAP